MSFLTVNYSKLLIKKQWLLDIQIDRISRLNKQLIFLILLISPIVVEALGDAEDVVVLLVAFGDDGVAIEVVVVIILVLVLVEVIVLVPVLDAVVVFAVNFVVVE